MIKSEHIGQRRLPPGCAKIVFDRIRPLMDQMGVTTRTLEHLLGEAYVLGLSDAVDIMRERKEA